MKSVSLAQVPNQSFEFSTEKYRYSIILNQITDTLLVSSFVVTDNSSGEIDVLTTGYPVVAGMPLIPFKNKTKDNGNFFFVTPNQEIPNWRMFGTSHELYYLDQSELENFYAIYGSTQT